MSSVGYLLLALPAQRSDVVKHNTTSKAGSTCTVVQFPLLFVSDWLNRMAMSVFRLPRQLLRSVPRRVMVLIAIFALSFTVTIFINSHGIERKSLCEPGADWSQAVAAQECKCYDSSNVTRVETIIQAPCPQVAGNVAFQGGADAPSIFARSAGYVKFERHVDSRLESVLNERASWISERWSNETVDIMKANTQDGVVIIALSNFGMKEMTMNWIASLKLNRYTKFVVLCFDFAMYRFLAEHGLESNAALIPGSWYNMTLESDFVQWGDHRYHAMLHGKMLVLLEIFRRGFTILHSDVDLVFLNPFVVKHILGEDKDINADFTYMVDGSNGGGDVINGGFWLARPTAITQDVWNQTYYLSTTNRKYVVDQLALNHIIGRERAHLKFSKNFRPLSRALYPSGLYLHVQKSSLNQQMYIYPMVAHLNWIVGMVRKKQWLKDLNMWYIKEDFAQ